MIVQSLNEFLNITNEDYIVSFDIETKETNPTLPSSSIMGMGFFLPLKSKGIYVPIYEYNKNSNKLDRLDTDIKLLNHIKNNYLPNIKTVSHNGSYEYKWLKYYGVQLNQIWDTRYAWHLISPEIQKPSGYYSLDRAISQVLDLDSHKGLFHKYLKSIGANPDKGEHYKSSTEELAKYCIEDCEYTWRLFEHQKPIVENLQAIPCLKEMYIPYANMLAEQADIGIPYNKKRALRYEKNSQKLLDKIAIKIEKEYPEAVLAVEEQVTRKEKGDNYVDQFDLFSKKMSTLNLSSRPQAGALLQELGVSIFEVTAEGNIKTDNDTLTKYKDKHPIVNLLLKYYAIETNKKFVAQYNPKANDTKFHLDCDICGTASGRLSCFEPNFLAINRSDKRFMKCFDALDDYVFISSDFSQIEPRITCHFSKDEGLKDIILNNKDLYLEHLQYIFPEKLHLYKPDNLKQSKRDLFIERDLIKRGILAMNYGAGVPKISRTLDIPIQEAAKIYNGYWKARYKIKNLENYLHKLIRVHGFVKNLFGRPVIMNNTKDILNRFIQSSGHDCLIALNLFLKEQIKIDKVEAYPAACDMHDETIWRVRKKDIEAYKQCLNKSMSKLNNMLNLFIPLQMDSTVVTNLSELNK